MSNLDIQTEPLFLRITKKPSFRKDKIVFFAVEVQPETWSKVDNKTHYIIELLANDHAAYDELDSGAICRIVPETLLEKQVTINDSSYNRRFVTTTNFTLVRSTGSLIIKLLANSNKFKSIGERKAARLWERFGEKLYSILDQGEIDELVKVLSLPIAESLIEAWELYAHTDALLFCSKLKLTASQSFRITRYYKGDTKAKIEDDPYRLLAFNISFEKCDEIATKQYGIPYDDHRRLAATVEEALYQILNSNSVVSDHDTLRKKIETFIPEDELVTLALQGGYENNNYVLLANGNYQSNGSYLMETFIANRFRYLLNTPIQLELSDSNISEIISTYESKNELCLTASQKEAVLNVAHNRLYIINGGAGVGKTTVLDCIYHVFDDAGITSVQVALAAKAAKKMTEATGREASTIARFIKRFNRKDINPDKLVLVIDESSMVDLLSMYKLLSFLPENVRLIIIGDDGQLPPVGYGLILHELLKVPDIQSTTLTEVKRQGKESNIPAVTQDIRNGIVPLLDFPDITFINSNSRKKVLQDVLSVYQEDVHNTQIICATRKMADAINEQCSSLNESKKLLAYNEYYDAFEFTGFRLSDKVMCTANLYDLDVLNASIGEIVDCYKETKEVELEINDNKKMISSFGQIKWDDGVVTEITDDLLDNLSHAYAMTIHKSQGSQFPTVIIPVFQAKYMDRTMLYTAITRAQKRVVLIGSEILFNNAISTVHSDERKADLANKILGSIHDNIDRIATI
ncbi:AAA family ATPase [Aliiglaciecola litoralis]|uniref:AAA family ATPase n=1 Tax=Aliiglaciecola litoralis TaxID=582857 RepID=A0ABN1LID2_9ALTE